MTRKECEAQYNHEQFLKALKRNAVRCYQCNVVRGWPVELVDCREPKNLTLGAWSFPGVSCARMVVRVAVDTCRHHIVVWHVRVAVCPLLPGGKRDQSARLAALLLKLPLP